MGVYGTILVDKIPLGWTINHVGSQSFKYIISTSNKIYLNVINLDVSRSQALYLL